MIRGSCCCGGVKFELTKVPSAMGTCHCSRCRKAGSSTSVFVERDSVKWIQGRELVATYTPEAPFKYSRNFCSRCGTSLGEILSNENSFPIAANSLDDDPIVRIKYQEFKESKPAWFEVCD